jgi:hypothetical protein
MTQLNLKIDRTDEASIKVSFDRIAKDIFRSAIKVNQHKLRITEIEFYFWSDEHKDYTTHEHNRNAGEWRMHNQGIDITFQAEGNKKSGQVGGVLIRGIYDNSIKEEEKKKYINGPRKVLFRLFELMGNVEEQSTLQLLPNHFEAIPTIYKAKRHGLNVAKTNTYEVTKDFVEAQYRYYTDKENLYTPSYWEKVYKIFPL